MHDLLVPARVDPARLDDPDLADLNDHLNRIRLERHPDFPPRPLPETRAWATEVAGFVQRGCWWVREPGGRVVAFASAEAYDIENNRHMVEVDMGVDADHRRRGVATALLGEVAAFARENDRRLLLLDSESGIPAGEAFLGRIGATRGLEVVTSRVAIADLDRDLLRRWREAGEAIADYELIWLDGPYPDEMLTEIADVTRVMNDAPIDDLDVGDVELTPEQLREDEASFMARGIRRWTVVAIHSPSGTAAGFSDLYWNPTIAHLGQQGDTGVRPEHRGHRLGKWMKAAMAERVIAERPEVTHIETSNAGSNEPMLAINREMGFRPHKAVTVWQIGVDEAMAAVSGR